MNVIILTAGIRSNSGLRISAPAKLLAAKIARYQPACYAEERRERPRKVKKNAL